MPPSYNSRTYWNERFNNEKTFDWLLTSSQTLSIVTEQLPCLSISDSAKILHIGCGNSGLSQEPPKLRGPNASITNVDFSETVIEAAKSKADDKTTLDGLRWIAADLLSLDDVRIKLAIPDDGTEGTKNGSYDLIIDKSTTDSIACGEDIPVTLPYLRSLLQTEEPTREAAIHPIHILALHLALLCSRPGSRWLVFSYSEHRFPFLEQKQGTLYNDLADGPLSPETVHAGFPDTKELWRLESKWSIETDDGSERDREKHMIYRPPELCWVYVLVRTSVDAGPGLVN